MVRVLGIAGSLRRDSFNRRILDVALRGAEAAGADVTLADLRDFPMPVYNPDDHEANGFDTQALRLQTLAAGHDGFLISSPEYNGSLSSALKNAIDWCSRDGGVPDRSLVFRGKAAAIMTAGPGAFGGLRVLAHLRGVLTSVGTHVLPTEVAVPYVDDCFGQDGTTLADTKAIERLERLGRELVRMLVLLRGG